MVGKIKRLLIANRGEIVCRIVATCRAMRVETVTVYAQDDKDLPHASAGDMSILLMGNALSETYLNIEKLIEAAKSSGADAIHPGYGFLSENARFAEAVTKAGLVFIGPPAHIIALMGDKGESRRLCQSIGVPVVPGYDGDAQDTKLLAKAAAGIGYPVLVKAAAGGGGKGMRIVESADALPAALEAARAEAKNAFGDDRVLLEKYLVQPRHIEVQVFSDTHGNHVHLFERDCSIQRRYQKVVEESPAPQLPEALRESMIRAAIAITSHIGYVGAGTVEFILDANGEFYFLEMNTRLQVEHPVTEMVTGLDLVQLQLQVAEGKALPFTQKEVKRHGHAMEVRLYAEDPDREFLPAPGVLSAFSLPHLPHVRCENGYSSGSRISANYDPMIAKLAAWGQTREETIRRLLNALAQVWMEGTIHNRAFLMRVLESEDFRAGKVSTGFIASHRQALLENNYNEDEVAALAAAYLLCGNTAPSAASGSLAEHSAWTRVVTN